eukprot:5007867-Prymnesium_polylepis.1
MATSTRAKRAARRAAVARAAVARCATTICARESRATVGNVGDVSGGGVDGPGQTARAVVRVSGMSSVRCIRAAASRRSRHPWRVW